MLEARMVAFSEDRGITDWEGMTSHFEEVPFLDRGTVKWGIHYENSRCVFMICAWYVLNIHIIYIWDCIYININIYSYIIYLNYILYIKFIAYIYLYTNIYLYTYKIYI